MANVKAFHVPGLKMWFYSGDHQPPHFHAQRPGHWDARVFILEDDERMIQVIRPPNGRIHAKDRRAIVAGVKHHRIGLMEEWEASQDG